MPIRHVNLLDLKATGQSPVELNYLAIIIVSSIILFACIGFAVWKKIKIDTLKLEANSLTEEVSKLSAASSSKNKKTESKDIISILNNPISWSKLFKEVANIVPASIQLSQLTGSLTGARDLVLTGSGQNQQDVFTLKNKLEIVPECSKTIITNLTPITFTIECNIR